MDVSVIILARNAEATIEQALRSVLPQKCVSEIVVVNDGSTDNTAKVVQGLKSSRIQMIPGPEQGFTAALNTGLRAARATFVALCDSDDWWSSDRLSWQQNWLKTHPDFIAVSGAFASATVDGHHVADLAMGGGSREVTEALRNGKSITSFCTWLTRRRELERVGYARVWFPTGSDIDLQFRLAEAGRVWHETRVCYHYRLHDASVTHTQAKGERQFYEAAAKRFAEQRRDRGVDDLMEGNPPIYTPNSEESANDDLPSLASEQIAGHLEGKAWKMFLEDDPIGGLGTMIRAVRHAPGSPKIWRGLATMTFKSLVRR